MSLSIIVAAMEAYKVTVELWISMLDGMSEEDRQEYLGVIAAREKWWSQHVWEPLGKALAGEVEVTDDADSQEL